MWGRVVWEREGVEAVGTHPSLSWGERTCKGSVVSMDVQGKK